ncbi:porin [Shewanella algicola]|uniref:porin n=1 Tax=Shewanella algicola TaxID=640633 RepID=UPI00249445F9|nr:porin [Shewanella algicola]
MNMNTKRHLVSIALLSALSVTSLNALADSPKAYGRLDIALTNADHGFTTQNKKEGTVLENNLSRLGVKGSEKINDDFKLVYQMEVQVNGATNEGSDKTFSARSTYLGVVSDAGTLLVGRNDTVMKSSKGTVEAFALTNAAYSRMIAGQDRKADGMTYYSPTIAGLFTINGTYLMDDNYEGSDETQYALSVVAGDKKLKKSRYYLAAAYNTIGGVDAYRGVGHIKMGKFKLGGLYQHSESQSFEQKEGDSYFVALAYNLNGVNLKVEYGKDKAGFGKYFKYNSAVASSTDYKQATDVDINRLVVGADYKLSKSTMLQAHYAMYDGEYQIDNAGTTIDLEDDNVATVGVRFNF